MTKNIMMKNILSAWKHNTRSVCATALCASAFLWNAAVADEAKAQTYTYIGAPLKFSSDMTPETEQYCSQSVGHFTITLTFGPATMCTGTVGSYTMPCTYMSGFQIINGQFFFTDLGFTLYNGSLVTATGLSMYGATDGTGTVTGGDTFVYFTQNRVECTYSSWNQAGTWIMTPIPPKTFGSALIPQTPWNVPSSSANPEAPALKSCPAGNSLDPDPACIVANPIDAATGNKFDAPAKNRN